MGNARLGSNRKRVINHGILWKQFMEAIRVMKLDYREHMVEDFKNLTNNHEATLQLHF